jgi:hypothetical protein
MLELSLLCVLLGASAAFAQTATVVRNVNLRPEQSSAYPPIRLLAPSEPPMDLLEPQAQDGYFRVRTTVGDGAGQVHVRRLP